MARRLRLSRSPILVLGAVVLTACSFGPTPAPAPTTVPTPTPEDAATVARRYLGAWRRGDHAAMYRLLAPSVRERYSPEVFDALHEQLRTLPRVTAMETRIGTERVIGLAPEPRPPDLPAPTPLATSAPGGSPASTAASSAASPGPTGGAGPGSESEGVLEGPVLAMEVPVELELATDLFGSVELERSVVMAQGAAGWQVRWSPASLFEELGDDGTLELARELPARGRILAADGTVLAQTRDDGVRIYPQEALAGQTIGYVSEVTAEDLEELAALGYMAGDVVGRSGLEAGAEELLRGRPAFTLSAVPAAGDPVAVLTRQGTASADLVTTLRPDVQAAAEAGVWRYAGAASAVIDPASGDVWALASSPPLNPNAFTLGTTLGGVPLPAADYTQILNNATMGTFPAGSSFKPFTLAAALDVGVIGPGSLVTCPPTWVFQGFTFENYEMHELPGLVSLADAMAFSCNTTYMPLSIDVYNADTEALPSVVADFGFGEPTGILHIAEEEGILPDARYFQEAEAREYGPFDQIQLSIGQGSFLGTPLQLAVAYAAIANGGTLWTPRLVTEVVRSDGDVTRSYDPRPRRQIDLADEHLAYVVETLRAVVERPYGTGYVAFAGFGLPVAGKSGTAETGGPDPDSWFAGFAPAYGATVSVATVLIREPLSTGGADAAPLVRQVMAQHFAG